MSGEAQVDMTACVILVVHTCGTGEENEQGCGWSHVCICMHVCKCAYISNCTDECCLLLWHVYRKEETCVYGLCLLYLLLSTYASSEILIEYKALGNDCMSPSIC